MTAQMAPPPVVVRSAGRGRRRSRNQHLRPKRRRPPAEPEPAARQRPRRKLQRDRFPTRREPLRRDSIGRPSCAGNASSRRRREPSKSNGAVRLELTAEEPVWVLARAGGKYLFSGTLEPKQTRSVEANGPLLLRLGNAGGVNITLNGKPLGAVGPKGQVRDVQFTSGGFQIVAAAQTFLAARQPI